MKLLAARALLRLLSLLPLPIVRGLARMLAAVWHRFGRRRIAVERNLARAFPGWTPAQRRALARENSAQLLMTALETGALWHWPRSLIEQRVVAVEGRERVDGALASGRGVLLLGGHLGQWELAMLYSGLQWPMTFLYKPPKSGAADRALTACRQRFGAELVPATGPALRRAVRRLRAGGALGLLFDQRPRAGQAVMAPWFGRSVATMSLPHRLIRTSGCVVLIAHCLRRPEGGWTMVFEPVPGADDSDPERAMAAMNRALQRAVERAPEQYLWSYGRD
ncbi:MAG: lipid A biosynthesis acyltransferase [Wenzhouxiangellaceae bacterium]|nr:lipid A biosynthesis acyltransferase [Wenzhouxiangellaceae bacterium]